MKHTFVDPPFKAPNNRIRAALRLASDLNRPVTLQVTPYVRMTVRRRLSLKHMYCQFAQMRRAAYNRMGLTKPTHTVIDSPVVKNAVRCGICGAPADRYDNRFQCQANAGHMGDLYVGIFSDLSRGAE